MQAARIAPDDLSWVGLLRQKFARSVLDGSYL